MVMRSPKTSWYHGPTFLVIETIDNETLRKLSNEISVQWVNRPKHDFRGFSGTVSNGTLRRVKLSRCCPFEIATLKDYSTKSRTKSCRGRKGITIQLNRKLDISRGDLIVASSEPCK